MLGIKELSLRGIELKKNYDYVTINNIYKHHGSRMASITNRLKSMMEKLATIGKNHPITKVEKGHWSADFETGNAYPWDIKKDAPMQAFWNVETTVYYPTHDDAELDYLIKRDLGEDALKLCIRTKISSGHLIVEK